VVAKPHPVYNICIGMTPWHLVPGFEAAFHPGGGSPASHPVNPANDRR
jgi:hypothetical protein